MRHRYAVYDEDHELIRIFDTKDEADKFCLRNWTVEVREAPPKRSPYEIASRLGDCLM